MDEKNDIAKQTAPLKVREFEESEEFLHQLSYAIKAQVKAPEAP